MRCTKCGSEINYSSMTEAGYWSCQDCGKATRVKDQEMYLHTSEMIGIMILLTVMLTVGGLMFKQNMELERQNLWLRRELRKARNK